LNFKPCIYLNFETFFYNFNKSLQVYQSKLVEEPISLLVRAN